MRRRTFFAGASVIAAGLAGYKLTADFDFEDGLGNPCKAPTLPDYLANHPLLQNAWKGLDPQQVWDCHCHLVGVGDSDSGIRVHPDLTDLLSPAQYLRFRFFMNAACAESDASVDVRFVRRLAALMQALPEGAKAMLLAFDQAYDERGRPLPEQSSFYTPNAWAQSVAAEHSQRFEWIASIHPYRADAVDELRRVVDSGARAIKWLPSAMNIDPSSARCDGFYRVMAELNLPLLTHAGEEQAVAGAGLHGAGNPLLLRRPLDAGVRVIVAHCASLGEADDVDKGGTASAFKLFARMMDEPSYRGRLFGDIAAITQANRDVEVLKTLLERRDWQDRMLNGSDYPLPGVLPLFNVDKWVDAGLLDKDVAVVLRQVRSYNPLLFDFLLKRSLRWQGEGFGRSVFETRRHFVR